MDPTATMQLLLDACRGNDREAALDALEALTDWLAKGGFVPYDPSRVTWTQVARAAR